MPSPRGRAKSSGKGWISNLAGAYREGEQEGYSLSTGSAEAAAKTLVGVRVKRAGARHETHGGQTILTLRAAVLSNRHALLMRALAVRYSAPVLAA